MTYDTWRDIPDDTDSSVFSLLWGDIKKAIASAGVESRLEDRLGSAPGWMIMDGAATADGWAYAAAVALAGSSIEGPASREEYLNAWRWREVVGRGVDSVLHYSN